MLFFGSINNKISGNKVIINNKYWDNTLKDCSEIYQVINKKQAKKYSLKMDQIDKQKIHQKIRKSRNKKLISRINRNNRIEYNV